MPQLTSPDDRLARRASKGDKRALAAIFERYHQELYRYCAAIVGNPEDARDALQNTMVKLLAALPGERRRIQLKPWLYRVAHNEAIEIVRRRRPTEPLDTDALAGAPSPDADAETRERLRHLVSDLQELPDRQRGALVMRELGGLSFEQIGGTFETSAAAVRQTVYEARLGLQEMERGRAMACEEIQRKLSDGDRRLIRRRDVRSHLRHCRACREFEVAIGARRHDLAAIAPLPALAAAGIVKGVLGGAFASAGGVAGAGAGTIAGSTAAKAVATLAVAGAIGVTAADRAHLIEVLPGAGRGGDQPAKVGGRESGSSSAPTGADGEPSAAGNESAAAAGAPRLDAANAAGGGKADAKANRRGEGAPLAPAANGTDAEGGSGQGTGHRSHGSSEPRAHDKGNGGGTGKGKANAHGANPHANPNAGTDGAKPAKGHSSGHAAGGGQAKEPKPTEPPAEAQPKSSPKQAATPQAAEPEPVEPGATERGKPADLE